MHETSSTLFKAAKLYQAGKVILQRAAERLARFAADDASQANLLDLSKWVGEVSLEVFGSEDHTKKLAQIREALAKVTSQCSAHFLSSDAVHCQTESAKSALAGAIKQHLASLATVFSQCLSYGFGTDNRGEVSAFVVQFAMVSDKTMETVVKFADAASMANAHSDIRRSKIACSLLEEHISYTADGYEKTLSQAQLVAALESMDALANFKEGTVLKYVQDEAVCNNLVTGWLAFHQGLGIVIKKQVQPETEALGRLPAALTHHHPLSVRQSMVAHLCHHLCCKGCQQAGGVLGARCPYCGSCFSHLGRASELRRGTGEGS